MEVGTMTKPINTEGTLMSEHIVNMCQAINRDGDRPAYVWTVHQSLLTPEDRDMVAAFIATQIKITHDRKCPAADHSDCVIMGTSRGPVRGKIFPSVPSMEDLS
jgi:hypothetical protein